jgi:hypothetical protein
MWSERRAFLVWGILISGCLAARLVLDVVSPAQDYISRAATSTYIVLAIYAVAGLREGWKTGRVIDGPAVATAATIVAALLSLVVPTIVRAVFAARIRQAPAVYAELLEGRGVSVPMMLIVGGTIATAGAWIGKRLGPAGRVSRSWST